MALADGYEDLSIHMSRTATTIHIRFLRIGLGLGYEDLSIYMSQMATQ
jgi:hypothetical protein